MATFTPQEVHHMSMLLQHMRDQAQTIEEDRKGRWDRSRNHPPVYGIPKYPFETPLGRELLELSWEFYDIKNPTYYFDLLKYPGRCQEYWYAYEELYSKTSKVFEFPDTHKIRNALAVLKSFERRIQKVFEEVTYIQEI